MKSYICIINTRSAMDIETFREYCLSVKGAEECLPFDDTTLVYKIMDKMFTYAPLRTRDGLFWANMKCDPAKSAELMEQYAGIYFGPHSDKKYWITVRLESDVPDALICKLILHTVDEVIRKLPKYKQAQYRSLTKPGKE